MIAQSLATFATNQEVVRSIPGVPYPFDFSALREFFPVFLCYQRGSPLSISPISKLWDAVEAQKVPLFIISAQYFSVDN